MNSFFRLVTLILIIILFVCVPFKSLNKNADLYKYEIGRTLDETQQDDFIFRLISEKEEYREGDNVKLYGELVYVGPKEEITIHHSSSVIFFPIHEKERGYNIVGVVKNIGLSTTLKRGKTYREYYAKNVVYSSSQDSKNYLIFIQDFLEREDFPYGYYVVIGYARFSVGSENKSEEIELKAKVNFRVVK